MSKVIFFKLYKFTLNRIWKFCYLRTSKAYKKNYTLFQSFILRFHLKLTVSFFDSDRPTIIFKKKLFRSTFYSLSFKHPLLKRKWSIFKTEARVFTEWDNPSKCASMILKIEMQGVLHLPFLWFEILL